MLEFVAENSVFLAAVAACAAGILMLLSVAKAVRILSGKDLAEAPEKTEMRFDVSQGVDVFVSKNWSSEAASSNELSGACVLGATYSAYRFPRSVVLKIRGKDEGVYLSEKVFLELSEKPRISIKGSSFGKASGKHSLSQRQATKRAKQS